jgi:phage terminase large subunit GpA-like protein
MNAEGFVMQPPLNWKLWPALRRMAKALQAPLPRTPDVWADRSRILPPGSASRGRGAPPVRPYLCAMFAAAVDPKYRRIVGVLGSQMGKTNSC